MKSTITIDTVKQAAINLAARGFSYREIAGELNSKGFRTLSNKRANTAYVANLLFRARKQGVVATKTAKVVTTKPIRTTEEFLASVKPIGISPTAGVELAKLELSRTVIGASIFTDEFKTNVVAAIFQN
jgi:hypothetical protein